MSTLHVLTSIVAAIVPTIIYSLLLWWLDRYEKEPLHLLFAAFFWGAIPAIALAVLFEFILAIPFERSPLGPHMTRLGIAPIVEEPLKAVALVGLFFWARHEFDGPLDGIVYGALIGFGFAMTENVLYFLIDENPSDLFWVRSVAFGMNHAFFTSMVGLAFGLVRYRHNVIEETIALLVGLTIAIILHATHNFLAAGFNMAGLLMSWIVQFSGIIVLLMVAVLSWRHERQWIEYELGEEIQQGLISAHDYNEIASPSQRMRQQSDALFSGGWRDFQRVRRFHHLATKLAFCKSKLKLADQSHCHTEVDQLRREITALRTALGR